MYSLTRHSRAKSSSWADSPTVAHGARPDPTGGSRASIALGHADRVGIRRRQPTGHIRRNLALAPHEADDLHLAPRSAAGLSVAHRQHREHALAPVPRGSVGAQGPQTSVVALGQGEAGLVIGG